MTWPHAWSGSRRVPLRLNQQQPFDFPDLAVVKRRAASAKSRVKRGRQHDVELEALRLARMRYEKEEGLLAFNGYREQLELADQRLLRRIAQSILSAREAAGRRA